MTKQRALRIALGVLSLGGALALWMVWTDEKLSRQEHEWRLGHERFFQDDFKPWEKKGPK